MKKAVLAMCLVLPGTPLFADGFVLGSGRWTCDKAIKAANGGAPIQVGQLAGWILGYWSAATFQREKGFIDIVEKVGGQKIYEATLAECSKAPPATPLYEVADRMIANTK